MPAIEQLVVAAEPGRWRELGFCVESGAFVAGSVTLRLAPGAGRGLVGWRVSGLSTSDLDGLPTELGDGEAPPPGPPHPNGARSVDHVVVATPDIERTLGALAGARLELRRRRDVDSPAGPVRQAFYRLGEVVLEVVAAPGTPAGPAVFWGLVFTVGDLNACVGLLGERLGAVKDAVQPGRRIATVRRSAGLGLPVALMSPDPRR